MTETLTNRDIQHYRREGYIVPDTRLPASTMTRLHTALDDAFGQSPTRVFGVLLRSPAPLEVAAQHLLFFHVQTIATLCQVRFSCRHYDSGLLGEFVR